MRLSLAQQEILTATATHRRVATRAGQKLGKSSAKVVAALWWAATRARARVLFTGPGNAQVRDVLWKELRRIVYSTRPDGKTIAEVLGVEPAIMPHTGMQWPDGREIVGWSRESPTATQGFSGPEVLIIIDEGCGVLDAIFAAHEGNTAAEGRILASSNPTSNIGWFFEAFHSHAEHWKTLHFSSEDSPNITGAEEAIPGLAGPEWLAEMRAKYGPGHPEYEVRVRGNFAGTSTNTIVGLALVDDAQKRWRENAAEERVEPLDIGVDVARFGDDETAIAPRRGRRIYPLETIDDADGNAVAGKILEVTRALRVRGERVVVKIDCTGGYGSSPADILRAHHSNEVDVVEVNSSSKSDDEDKFSNLRAQLHFGVAQWLSEGGELPPDAKLKVELLAPTYKFDQRRRYLVEPKVDIKRRIQRSPDRADAVALSIYGARAEPARTVAGTGTRYDRSEGGRGFF